MQAYYNENSSQSFSCISMVLTDGSVSGKWVTDFKLDPGQGAGIDLANPGVTDIECYLNSFTYFPSDHRFFSRVNFQNTAGISCRSITSR